MRWVSSEDSESITIDEFFPAALNEAEIIPSHPQRNLQPKMSLLVVSFKSLVFSSMIDGRRTTPRAANSGLENLWRFGGKQISGNVMLTHTSKVRSSNSFHPFGITPSLQNTSYLISFPPTLLSHLTFVGRVANKLEEIMSCPGNRGLLCRNGEVNLFMVWRQVISPGK